LVWTNGRQVKAGGREIFKKSEFVCEKMLTLVVFRFKMMLEK